MADNKSKLTLVKFNKADLLKGKHILIVESQDSRRAVALNKSVFSVGRHPQNALVLSGTLVSRHHATIAWFQYSIAPDKYDYSFWIIDGKGKRQRSQNGISINGTKKSLHRLQSGDIITIGSEIKITYNYITYSTDTNDFLNYCDSQKRNYQSNNEKNYKETLVVSEEQNQATQLWD
ncbi:FHA domain-containing protein [Xenococcus sp. PCC 7305]|uniref:FHA domain-containing protein n=1 Tax=Xenococcus sp. PCC 7305 TaxID=102125 RepID=UPI0002ABE496|nr:FHA domain-containing protein [Xenococcus sp. PCC 7305]ELS03796.1 FHA domain-containing protein [Xenococcus sp. PCC 7305]